MLLPWKAHQHKRFSNETPLSWPLRSHLVIEPLIALFLLVPPRIAILVPDLCCVSPSLRAIIRRTSAGTPNDALTKRVLLARRPRKYYIDSWVRISGILNVSKFQDQKATQNKAELTSLMKENLNLKVELDSKASDTHRGGQ